jgi:hypothetical protein
LSLNLSHGTKTLCTADDGAAAHAGALSTGRLLMLLSGFYLWLGFMSSIPHKEERFMFPVYPLLVLGAALAISTAVRLVGRLLDEGACRICGECGPRTCVAGGRGGMCDCQICFDMGSDSESGSASGSDGGGDSGDDSGGGSGSESEVDLCACTVCTHCGHDATEDAARGDDGDCVRSLEACGLCVDCRAAYGLGDARPKRQRR